jgi:uncharacterized protein (TIGR02646 family)
MLNINTRISLSSRSKKFISVLKRRQGGSFNTDSWNRVRKSVKNEISGKLFANQGFKCVYCERYLIAQEPQIDHFAHKGDYPQFTFTPVNLFYSCGFCNSPDRKGQQNTIDIVMPNYNDCTFSIIHPYYHIPNNELSYTDPDRIYFDRNNCSPLGIATIDFFRWDDFHYTYIRAKNLTSERIDPLTTVDEINLIQQAISYKP